METSAGNRGSLLTFGEKHVMGDEPVELVMIAALTTTSSCPKRTNSVGENTKLAPNMVTKVPPMTDTLGYSSPSAVTDGVM